MSDRTLHHYLHRAGEKPQMVVGAPGETLRAMLIRVGVITDGQGDVLVFIGEWNEALGEPLETNDGCDSHAPVDLELTLEVLELHRHRHIHVHHCKHIATSVFFAGEEKRHRFSPATTVEVATEWARKKFHLGGPSASEFVLRIRGTKIEPRPEEHLGELVQKGSCALEFDLVKEVTPQG